MWRTFRRQGWRATDVGALIALLGGAILLTWPIWSDIAHIAQQDEENSHILLVLPIAAWMFWIRRGRLRQCRLRHRWAGPLIAAFGIGMSNFGWFNGVDAAWHAGAVVTLVGAFVAVGGTDFLVRFAPVFLVLVFLVPVPGPVRQAVALPLQSASAQCTQFLLDLSGLLTERSGNLIVLDGMPIAVAEACNGMRMAFALLLVMYAFAFSIPMVNGVRLLLLLASPIVAVAANVMRLVPTVLAYARMESHTADALHDVSGWLMLGVAFVALLGVESVLRWALIPTQRFTLAQKAA